MMQGRTDARRGRDKCEECGAPLDPPDVDGNQTCRFCNKTYNTPSRPEPSIDTATSISITIDSAMARPARRSRIAALIITSIIIISVGAGIAATVGSVGRAIGRTNSLFDDIGGGSSLRLESTPVVLDGEPTAPTRFVAAFASDSSQSRQIMLIDSSNKTPVWRSGKLNGDSPNMPLAVDATRAFTSDKARIVALDLTDGHEIWRQSLTDSLPSPCEMCLFTVGDRVIARTQDGNVMAFDAATGNGAWSRRLTDVMAQVRPTGAYVSVLDGQGGTYSVDVIEPANGAVVHQLSPNCSGSQISGHDALMLTRPGDPSLYLAFDLIPGCWQRWDLATGAQVWAVEIEDTFFDRGAWAFIEGETIYFASRGRETMGRIDTATGGYEMLPGLPDTESVPIAVHGNTLILRAKSSRGTSRYSLWGLDLASGNVPWQYLFEEAAPVDPPDATTIFVSDDSRFSVHLEGDTVRVVTFDGASKVIVTEAIDADTGVSRTTGAVTGATSALLPDFTPVAWRGSRFVAVVGDSVLDIETSSGSLESRWP